MAVPFTTPELAFARLRRGQGGREFLLPNPSGGQGNYVLSWPAIRAMMPISMFDRLLYDLVEKQDVSTPLMMRTAELQVTATGISGPVAARKAREDIEEVQQYQLYTTFTLTLSLLKAANMPEPDLSVASLHSESVQRQIKAALLDLAASLQIQHDELHTRIEVLAALVSPLGLGSACEAGYLRQMAEEVGRLRDALREYSEMGLDDVSTLAEFEADTANLIHGLVTQKIGQIDIMMASLINFLTSWDTYSERLISSMLDLSWLLDGWGGPVRFHRAAQRSSREQQAELVVDLLPRLPIIPSAVRDGGGAQKMEALSVVQRRRVQPHTDWRSGVVDVEQVRRIEMSKASLSAAAPKN